MKQERLSSRTQARPHYLVALRGLLLVGAGMVMTTLWWQQDLTWLRHASGLFLLASGSLDLLLAFNAGHVRHWRPLIGAGVLQLGLSVFLLAPVEVTAMLLVTLLGIWMLYRGFVMLWYALLVRFTERDRLPMVLVGVVGAVIGTWTLAWTRIPTSTFLSLLAAYLLISGVLHGLAALRLHPATSSRTALRQVRPVIARG